MKNNLTGRENEVLELLLEGHSYKEMAEKLYITLNTVKYHTGNIYQKMGVKSRMELMANMLNSKNK